MIRDAVADSEPSRKSLGPAPADARPRERWPRWRMVLAYAVLAALAAAAIWFIDLKAHHTPVPTPQDNSIQ
jgi:hypothetical protein